jgi:pyruvate dehydrogenase E2 component (dihydrolipoamide acetyltransferase)
MIEFRMPALGADMEAGTLVEWLKKPGDEVARGDIIAVVDAEKGAIEIEVFDAGVIERHLIAPGQKTPVGTLLALIRPPTEPAGAIPEHVSGAASPAPSPATSPAPSPATPSAGPTRSRVSCRSQGRGAASGRPRVEGRGPGGSITVADVERAAAVRKASGSTLDRLAGMRAAMAAAMAHAQREIPHLYCQ